MGRAYETILELLFLRYDICFYSRVCILFREDWRGMKKLNKLGISKPKKFKKTAAINKLDKLFSLKVRSMGQCFLRGMDKVNCGGPLQCAHVIGRGNKYLRWHSYNGLCLCAGHHVYYTYHPEAWREIMMKTYKPHYTWLLAHKETTITFNELYYKQKLSELE